MAKASKAREKSKNKFGAGCPFEHPAPESGQSMASMKSTKDGTAEALKKSEGKEGSGLSGSGMFSGREERTTPIQTDIDPCNPANRKGTVKPNTKDVVEGSTELSDPHSYLAGNHGTVKMQDMFLKAEGMEFPVNSALILTHSKVLGQKILEVRRNNPEASTVPLVASLPRESRADVQLLLEFLYCYRTQVNMVEEAAALLDLAHKYQISFPVALCEEWLCRNVCNMHICGIHHDPRASASITAKSPKEKHIWSLAKWLSIAEQLGMKRLEKCCLCALTTIFVSDAMQHDGNRAAVVSELVDEYKVSSRSMATLAGVMGAWISNLAQSWWCRKCGDDVSIPREKNCNSCGQSYYEDCVEFGMSALGNLVGRMREDEEIVMSMLDTFNIGSPGHHDKPG